MYDPSQTSLQHAQPRRKRRDHRTRECEGSTSHSAVEEARVEDQAASSRSMARCAVANATASLSTASPNSGKVVAIKVHYLVPRSRELLHKRLLRVVAGIDFCDCSELGVGTEEEIDARAGPLDFVRSPIAPLKHAIGCSGSLPLRIHVEQVDEEIIRQRLGPVGEDAVFGLPEVRLKGAHAADENYHLGASQCQQLRPIPQQVLS